MATENENKSGFEQKVKTELGKIVDMDIEQFKSFVREKPELVNSLIILLSTTFHTLVQVKNDWIDKYLKSTNIFDKNTAHTQIENTYNEMQKIEDKVVFLKEYQKNPET